MNRSEVMHLLERGSRTNRLTQLFAGVSESQVSSNTTAYNNTFNIQNSNDFLYIRINFRRPQFGIATVREGNIITGYELAMVGDERIQHNRNIYQIVIPLGNQSNMFQEQTWFMSTQPRGNDNLSFRFQTWGNYYRLAQFAQAMQMI